jgi:hypothetical protein
MLSRVVLNDTLKPIYLEVPLAAIAIEQLLLMRLRVGFDLGVENPLHVFQGQFLREGPVRGVRWIVPTGDTSCHGIRGHLVIESSPYVCEHIDGKPRTGFLSNLLAVVPPISNDLVGKTGNISTDRRLHFFPVFVHQIPGFLGCRQRSFKAALVVFPFNRPSLGSALGISLFGVCSLSQQPWFEKFPSIIIQRGYELRRSLE